MYPVVNDYTAPRGQGLEIEMKTAEYTATYYNSNGPCTSLDIFAKTDRGAKAIAWARATGDQSGIVLYKNGEVVARRETEYGNNFAQTPARWYTVPNSANSYAA